MSDGAARGVSSVHAVHGRKPQWVPPCLPRRGHARRAHPGTDPAFPGQPDQARRDAYRQIRAYTGRGRARGGGRRVLPRKVMIMRVFVAGGTGVVGRRLVPRLVARGHQVTATTTSAAKLGLLAQLGAEGVVMDGLDAASVTAAVTAARPDTIVHQMTAISLVHAGKPDLRHMDRWFAPTIRLRIHGTDNLLAAAEAVGVSHFVAQSYAAWNGIREGGWVKTEDEPLDLLAGTSAHPGAEALRHVEEAVLNCRRRGPAVRRPLRAGRY